MALPLARTAEGFEMQIGTNHLGHFALTSLLWPRLVAARPARIVVVGSIAHFFGSIRFHDLNWEKSYSRWPAYCQSKLANMLFAKELARRAELASVGVTTVACHPGYASTNLQTKQAKISGSSLEETIMNLGNGAFAQSSAWGALPTLYAATQEVEPGSYIGPGGPLGLVGLPTRARVSRRAEDPGDRSPAVDVERGAHRAPVRGGGDRRARGGLSPLGEPRRASPRRHLGARAAPFPSVLVRRAPRRRRPAPPTHRGADLASSPRALRSVASMRDARSTRGLRARQSSVLRGELRSERPDVRP